MIYNYRICDGEMIQVDREQRKKTMREKVLDVFTKNKNKMLTATQISEKIGDVKLSSLSSLLVKMVCDRTLQRTNNFGVRGGYGYQKIRFIPSRYFF